jgi:hypothetical protein
VKLMIATSETFVVTINEKVHKIINEVIRSLEGHRVWCSQRC